MEKLQWIQNKILSRERMLQQCNVWRAMQQKIVFTNGCFDILHHGHIDQLAHAADFGNRLIVAVNTNSSVSKLKGPERPVNDENDRALLLAALLCVDAVCLFDEDTPAELIKMLKPDVLVKGGDYTVSQIAGADFVLANGGAVEIIPFVEGYSTTGLLGKIKKL